MKLSEVYHNLIADERRLFRPYFIPDEVSDLTEFKHGESYFHLKIAQVFLKNRREIFKTTYPAIHALMRFSGLESTTEVTQVIVPIAPGQDGTSRADRIVMRNMNLLGDTLYRGGSLELLIGLYSAPAVDWAERFLDLAHGISEIALQVPLSATAAIGQPLKKAIEQALGSDQIELKLGYNEVISPEKWFRPGYLILVATPADEVNEENLFVDEDTLYYSANPYIENDFILLRIEGSATCSDWQKFGLGSTWKHLMQTAATSDDIQAVKDGYLSFAGLVMGNSELSASDQKAICLLAQDKIKEARKSRSTDFLDGYRGNADLSEEPNYFDEYELMRAKSKTEVMTLAQLVEVNWIDS